MNILALWQLTVTVIGAPLPGEHAQIAGAVLWPDGSSLVAEQSTRTLTRYAPDGRVLWTFGRDGAGPGEFRGLQGVVRCQNGVLAAYDAGLMRLTFLTDAGKLVTVRQDTDAMRGRLVWCRDTADVVMGVERTRHDRPPAPGGTHVEPLELMRFAKAKAVLATGSTEIHVTRSSMGDLPFGERANVAGGSGYVFLCQTGSGTCSVTQLASGQRGAFTVATPDKTVTDADWQYARSVRAAAFDAYPAPVREGWAKMWAELPQQKRFGRFEAAYADASDRLWVRTYERYGQATALWLVLTPSGQQTARVVTPAGLEPLAWAGDQFLGMTRDADGVPVLRRYRAALP